MVELSDRTRAHVRALFAASDIDAVERTLATDCADNLPLLAHSSPHDLERVRFAVLRLSGGRLDALAKAVRLAQADWRDLLVAAGFANDTQAHVRWEPRRTDFEED